MIHTERVAYAALTYTRVRCSLPERETLILRYTSHPRCDEGDGRHGPGTACTELRTYRGMYRLRITLIS